MAYIDVVEKAIDKRITEFEKVVENGDDFDGAVAGVIVIVLKDLKNEVC